MLLRAVGPQTEADRSPSPIAVWKSALVLTGVTCLCARLSAPLPFTPVPVTLQVFAVLLSGLLLGRRGGALAQANYLLLGACGLPVFALGTGSIHKLFGLTGGYLWSYPLAAFVVGWFAERTTNEATPALRMRLHALGCAAGLAIIYCLGCGWLALLSRPMLSPLQAIVAGAGWFIVWDAAKAVAAIGTANALRRP